MILEQYYLGCLAQAAYLVADEDTRLAALIDPRRDIEEYVRGARDRGLEIRHVVLTHFHADFISGHVELQRSLGARIYLGARARAEYEFTALADGSEIALGSVRLRCLETPGHTPESICVLIYDASRGVGNPHAVLTGDTLFIGDVGRPDLMASVGYSAEDLAGMLYDSLHTKLLTLPEETLVYPGHGAGSMCGKSLSRERVSTIGDQKRLNYALRPMSRQEFTHLVTADLPSAPDYFAYDADLNRRNRQTLGESLEEALRPLALDEVERLQKSGAQILDVRDPREYSSAHLKGSFNIGLQGTFATWCGTVLARDKPIVIVADGTAESEAALRLGRIGFDHVAGYLQGGIATTAARPDLLRHTPRVTAAVLAERLSSADPPQILDVRTIAEWNDKRMVGSVHIPLQELIDRLDEVPRNSNFVVHCASGYRSSIAASILEQHGFTNFSDLTGGYLAWELTDAPLP